MRITTRGQLAVSAMTDLALHQKLRPVALSTISARQGTSLSYLEQLFSALRRAGLVDSTRGPGGGYTLARNLDQISVAEIILAVEGKAVRTEADLRKALQAEKGGSIVTVRVFNPRAQTRRVERIRLGDAK